MIVRRLLLIIALGTACKSGPCKNERGAPVTPGSAPTTIAPRTLTLGDVERELYGAGPDASFAATTPTEHAAIAKLVPSLLDASFTGNTSALAAWNADAAAAGFRVEIWTIANGRYLALLEAAGRVRGAGAYLFRIAPRGDEPVILLQAPHAFHDVSTGTIAAALFFAARDGVRPRALFTNTIHRYQLAPGNKKKRKHNPADVAHNADHAFTIATEAFALAAGKARVIQIHGFAPRSDEDDADGDTGAIGMVVSAGDTAGSSPISAAIAAAAKQAFGPDVKRFPEDVAILGATTNVQKRMLERTGRGEFVHVELSAVLRDKLVTDEETRRRFAAVLFDTQAVAP